MRRPPTIVALLLAALAHAQPAKDDDLSSAFGPPPAAKVFEPEHNVPAPSLPVDPNAAMRATFEKDLAAAATREQLTMVELSAIALGGPERVRVHRLQRAVAVKLADEKAIKDADEKWLGACGPNDVAACRTEVLDAMAAYDRPRADALRTADACLTAAEQRAGKPPPSCVDAAFAKYQRAGDTLMVARVELARALALASDRKQAAVAKKALLRIAGTIDDRTAHVRRTALDTLSRLELAEGVVDAAAKDAILGAEAWASALPPGRRAWARTPAVDAACEAYDKAKGAGACRKLEKRLLSEYLFHDFSDEHLADGQLISHEKLVAVNEHYGVMIQSCLAAEIRSLDEKTSITYRVKWLVINNGHVDNFHSESTDQEQSRFVQCLREQFGYWRYPSHEGDPQRIEQGFSVKSSTRTYEETEK